MKLKIVLILSAAIFIPILFAALLYSTNYLTIDNDFYSTYYDIDPQRFERDYFPKELPIEAYDIHKQTDIDMGVTWIRYQVPEDVREKMIKDLPKLTQEESNPSIVFLPARDVDWWFDGFERLNADIYVTECAGLLDTGYIAVAKDSSYVYYWCS